MYSKYIIGFFMIAVTGFLSPGRSEAQNKDSLLLKDSALQHRMTPGRFFNVGGNYSTGAVSTVYGDLLYKTPSSNLANTLTGRLPGLYVKTGTGEPLGVPALAGATFLTIRGRGSYGYSGNNGYNTFRVYVDGFETTLDYLLGLPAAEIESISVLKDAAALATFGMQGDNGVIWVVTKRGKIGKPAVQFQVRTGRQKPANMYKPLGSYDYARLYNIAASNDNGNVWAPRYSEAELQAYKDGNGTRVDWYDEVLRNSAPSTDGNLIFTGGDSMARYNVTLSYLNQHGLFNVGNTDETSNEMLKRYNIYANLDFNLFKIFQARVDVGGRIEDHQAPNYNSGSLWNNINGYPSNIYPVMEDSGKWSGTALYPDNPAASIKALGWTLNHYRILQGNFGLKEKLDFITPGLYLDESYSFNSFGATHYAKTATYARYFNGATTTTDKTTPIKAEAEYPAGQVNWKQANVTLGYDRLFGGNHLMAAVNYHLSDYKGDDLYSLARHFENISGRVHYDYGNRYIGEVAFSYFGSDAYAPGNRWGFYPAVSAAWIISNESFLADNHAIRFLKLKASAGRTGNTQADVAQDGRYLYQQYYQPYSLTGGDFLKGNDNPSGVAVLAPVYTANPDVFAEQSLKYNVGADINLFDKLELSLDAFLDKRSRILTQDNVIPDYFGYNIIYKNIGKMTNRGLEINAAYTDKRGAVGYTFWAAASFNKNRIDYMAEVPPAYPYNAATGRALGTPIGLVAAGYYQLEDFNPDGTLKTGEPVPDFGQVQPGDLKYKDLDKDGKIDQTDITAVGRSPIPALIYSFGGEINFKSFDLQLFFTGAGNFDVDILNSNWVQTAAFLNNGNVFSLAENAWAYYPGQDIDTRAKAAYPRLTTEANTNNYRTSSFWIKKGDFLRLHNAELGYTFPNTLLKRIGLQHLRVYVNAMDIFTWSSLLRDYHMDPETISGYPNLKSFNTGFSVTF